MSGFSEICQNSLHVVPWRDPALSRLPGILPLKIDDWLVRDEVFAPQMAYRDHLLANKTDVVFRTTPGASRACQELLQMVSGLLSDVPGYVIADTSITRPDGAEVALEGAHPLMTAARLAQEDFCILQKQDDEHVLTAGALCFPSSWSLDEKMGRPLVSIHEPVDNYDGDVARRVQRLFDLMHPDRPLWRANTLVYSDPDLHQPRRENARRTLRHDGKLWLRSERQCLVKLPQTGAVVFSIHTWVVPFEKLDPEDLAALPERHRKPVRFRTKSGSLRPPDKYSC